MCPWLVWCHSGPSDGGKQKSTTFGESTSIKLLDCWAWKLLALGEVPGDGTEVRGGIYINRGRVGEERGGKEINGCPLTEWDTEGSMGMAEAGTKWNYHLMVENTGTEE
jgi:hypothetical protein